MLNKKIILLFVIVLLGITSIALAQEQEIKDYTVQKGDTLWDISTKELSDPFLWPKVWKENPDIVNPDKIRPGQIVKIPLYLIRKEEAPQEAVVEEQPVVSAEPPMPKAIVKKTTPPLVHKNIYTTSGFLGTMDSFAGTIDGHFSERTLYGNNDVVYVKVGGNAKAGDRFYIYAPLREVSHPVTREKMGSIIVPVGVLEITKLEHGHVIGQIMQAFTPILAGFFLNPYVEMKPPVIEQPFRRPDIKGYIVAARKLQTWNVTNDIVYLDRGSRDGLKPGDLIGSMSPSGLYNRPYNVPNGLLQVISTQEKTSTAIVAKINDKAADRLIVPGNVLIKAE